MIKAQGSIVWSLWLKSAEKADLGKNKQKTLPELASAVRVGFRKKIGRNLLDFHYPVHNGPVAGVGAKERVFARFVWSSKLKDLFAPGLHKFRGKEHII